MLAFLLNAEDDTLREFAQSSKGGHAAKTLIKQGPLRITLVALKRGTVLPSHQVAGPVSIQTVRGSLEVVAGDKKVEVPQGGLLALAPSVAHTARALRDCAILITVVMPNALPELGGHPIGSAVR
jgi:quercetin dioxygenase-like cupin family protein